MIGPEFRPENTSPYGLIPMAPVGGRYDRRGNLTTGGLNELGNKENWWHKGITFADRALRWLDKPGRVLRTGLADLINQTRPEGNRFDVDRREYRAILPFSDELELTDWKKRITGRELLGMSREPGKDESVFSRNNLAGIGAEMALNPLNIASFGSKIRAANLGNVAGKVERFGRATGGSLTEAGETLGRFGLLPMKYTDRLKGLSKGMLPQHLVDEVVGAGGKGVEEVGNILARVNAGETVPLMGVMKLPGVGVIGAKPGLARTVTQALTLPFSGPPLIKDFVGNQMRGAGSKLGNFVETYIPLGLAARKGRQLFSGKAGGNISGVAQDIAEYVGDPLKKQAAAEADEIIYSSARQLYDNGIRPPTPQANDEYVRWLRNQVEMPTLTPQENPIPSWMSPAQAQAALDNAKGQMARYAFAKDMINAAGGSVQDAAAAVPEGEMAMEFFPRRYTGPVNKNYGHAAYRAAGGTIPGSAIAREESLQNVATSISNMAGQDMNLINLSRQVSSGAVDKGQLMAYVSSKYGRGVMPGGVLPGNEIPFAHAIAGVVDSRAAANGIRMFDNDPLIDVALATQDMLSSAATLNSVNKAVGLHAKPMAQGLVPIQELLSAKDLYTSPGRAAEALVESINAAQGLKIGVDDLARLGVDPGVMEYATRAIQAKAELPAFLGLYNQIFKPLATLPFPGYHATNTWSGFVMNMINGTRDPFRKGLASIVRPYEESYALLGGRTVKGMADDLGRATGQTFANDQEAASWITREAIKDGAIDRHIFHARHDINQMFQQGNKAMLLTPGEKGYFSSNDVLPNLFGFNKLNPVVNKLAGLSSYSDSLNRLAHYISKVKQTGSTEAAKLSTVISHYDFKNLSPFEKNWMKTIFPFYNWTRQNIPYWAEEFVSRPGVFNALGRASMMGQNEFTPEYLQGRLTLPWGSPKEEIDPVSKRRKNDTLLVNPLPGMAHEDAMQLLARLGPTWTEAGRRLGQHTGGMLNPLVRTTLETTGLGLQPYYEQERSELAPGYQTEIQQQLSESIPGVGNWMARNVWAPGFWQTLFRNAPGTGGIYNKVGSVMRNTARGIDPIYAVGQELGLPRFRSIDQAMWTRREAADRLRDELQYAGANVVAGRAGFNPNQRLQVDEETLQKQQALNLIMSLRSEDMLRRSLEEYERMRPMYNALRNQQRTGPLNRAQEQTLGQLDILFRQLQPGVRSRLGGLVGNRIWRDLGRSGRPRNPTRIAEYYNGI